MKGLVEWISSLPRQLQIVWVVWGIALLGLMVATARFRQSDTVDTLADRLAALEERDERQYEDLLQEIRRRPAYYIGNLSLPAPAPEQKLGWRAAIIDTQGAKSLNDIEAEAASAVFEPVAAPVALVNRLLSGNVRLELVRFVTLVPNGPKESGEPRYSVELRIRNLTPQALQIEIPRGQVFENLEPHSGFQNLVAAERKVLRLQPNAATDIQVLGFCLNQRLRAPNGQSGNITHLKIRSEFEDQFALWRETQRAVSP